MPTPEVIDGYRAPRSTDTPAERQTGTIAAIPEGKVVFQSRSARYRRQLTSPEEVRRSDGTTFRPRALKAQFDENILVLDKKKDAETIERLMADEFYGIDFWDLSERLAQAEEKRKQDAVKLLDDPETKQRIIEALRASGDVDFALPGKDKVPVESKSDKPAAK